MKFSLLSLLPLLALTAVTSATLDFIDAISSSTGTTSLSFTNLTFNTPFTLGWVDGSSSVNISIWIKYPDFSSQFLETIASNEEPSGSFTWTPTTSPIPQSATVYPPRNSNIIGARDEQMTMLQLMTGTSYRIVVADDETTVFSPSFTIAAAAGTSSVSSTGSTEKKGGMKLSKGAIAGIAVVCTLVVLAALGGVAFILWRKKMQKDAKREILQAKMNGL